MRRLYSAAMLVGTVLALGPATSEPAAAQSKEYQPLGGRLGGFLVFPSVEFREIYNDNIYTTENGEIDSWITRIVPSLVVQSDWNRHDLRFEVGGEAGFYSHDSDDDYIDFQALADATIDVYHGATIFFESLGYERLHEDRGSDEIPGAAAETWDYSRYGGDGGVRYKPNRFGIEISGGYHRLEYDNLDVVGGGTVSGDSRDRDEFSAGAEIGYDFSPGYFAYVGGRYYWVDYDTATSFGSNRDSEGYLVEAGVRFEATPLIDVDIAAGYREQDYESSSLNDVNGFSLRGQATWFVTPLTTVGFTAFTEVQETIASTASGKLARGVAVTVDHELLRNLVFDAELAYTNFDYQGGSANRTDNDYLASLGATYFIGRNFYAGTSYRFNMRDSDASGEDYTQNLFMLKLGARF